MITRTRVLKGKISDTNVSQVFYRSVASLLAADFHFEAPVLTAISNTFTVTSWHRPDDSLEIQLVEDDAMPARWFSVVGRQAEADHVLSILEPQLPIWPLDELEKKASLPAIDPGAVTRLALGAEEYSDNTFEIIARALRSRKAEIRIAAAMATGVLRWPQFVPGLQTAAEKEPNEAAKRVLQRALEACQGAE